MNEKANPAGPMKWEQKKEQERYTTELKMVQTLIDKMLKLQKDLDAANAGRNQYHKG